MEVIVLDVELVGVKIPGSLSSSYMYVNMNPSEYLALEHKRRGLWRGLYTPQHSFVRKSHACTAYWKVYGAPLVTIGNLEVNSYSW